MSGIEEITHNEEQYNELVSFLSQFDLTYENDIDYSIAIYDKGHIVATASKAKQVLKCFAVDEAYQGRGITNALIKKIEDRMFLEGLYHFFIYTKSCNKKKFTSIGYSEIITSNGVTILENGNQMINRFIDGLKKSYQISDEPKASIIMNANPFTLGHQHLVEEAARHHREVLVFVVSEDRSAFPFDIRFKLVKEGLMHLNNVTVLETGPYLISQATFPTYFLKHRTEHSTLHARIDCDIFLKYYKPSFNITSRYVGEEPYCKITKMYNHTMKEVLEEADLKVNVVKRIQQNQQAISASNVRKELIAGNIDQVKQLVPDTTFKFLVSEHASTIIENLKHRNKRH